MSDKNTNNGGMKIEDLALMMKAGFEEADKKTDSKIDDLAAMMQRGFEKTATKADLEIVKEELRGEMAEMRSELKSDIAKVVYTMDTKFDETNSKLSNIEVRLSGVEESLKGEVIPRGEFDDLTSRVKYTELKLGVQSGK